MFKRKWSILMYASFGLLAITLVASALTTPGCTTIQNPDGSTRRVLGFESKEAQDQARKDLKDASESLPYPFNKIVDAAGQLLILGVGVYAAKKKGEEIGWDSKVADDKKALAQPSTPSSPTA